MDKRKLCIIFNPAARGGKAASLYGELKELAGPIPIFRAAETDSIQALTATVANQGYDHIVAAGGDGTVNGVINGTVAGDVLLSVLPLGTMNVFAYELGIRSSQLKKCWEMIQLGRPRTVDLVLANQNYFVQLAGVGLDAMTVQATDLQMRKTIGPVSYLLSAAKVIGRPAPTLRLKFEDNSESAGCFVLIGNGRFYGGPFSLFQDARNDDGLLDLLIFKHQSYLDIFRYLQGVLIGNHTGLPDIEYRQVRSAQVVSEEPIALELDGDVAGSTPVQFQIAPKKLQIVAG
ncbi:MAG: diacylglycerol kinase family lipid kinase [Verrucomicrobia bacterium]|nr:diacylglycerol kinase family lipid kinase [Verrucomicrobiota bacterium]MBV8277512.1 diacylglycerol kinase family lipid kinase [Verrucomicrobiota bacterium]